MKLCIAPFAFALGLSMVGGVEGAADCAPASGSLTIKTSQDVTDLTTCTAFSGNVVVAADGPKEVTLDGLKYISGNLDVENVANLESLSSASLEAVSSITLNNLPQLTNLTLPSLTNFSSLKWSNLPSLDKSTIATGPLQGEVQAITVFNTSLAKLDWLIWPIGAVLNISSNAQLASFTIPYASINAGSALTFSDNPSLKAIDVSSLSGIYGGLDISGNDIATLDFVRLETIGGFVQLYGDYTNVSMPALSTVTGALSVYSTADIGDFCQELDGKKLQGHYDCSSNNADGDPSATTSPGASATATSTSVSSPEPDEKQDKVRISKALIIGVAIAVFILTILVLVFAFICFRRRSRAKVREIDQDHGRNKDKHTSSSTIELTDSPSSSPTTTEPKELETSGIRMELDSRRREGQREAQELEGMLPQEMDAWHGRSELMMPVSRAASVSSVYTSTPLVRHELPA